MLHRGASFLGVWFNARMDGLRQSLIDLRSIRPDVHRLLIVGHGRHAGVSARPRQLTRTHLIRCDAERKDVEPLIGLLPTDKLGCHIVRRARPIARFEERALRWDRESKIGQLENGEIFGEYQIARADVAMYVSLFVDALERLGDLLEIHYASASHQIGRDREHVVQSCAAEILHDQILRAVGCQAVL